MSWDDHDVVINAAAYTAVDAAETPAGRRDAWAANVTGVARLVERVRQHGGTLVHLSSDYVFDGEPPVHDEPEPPAPLSAYGTSKAAGDALVSALDHHYVVRTSWLVGDGGNFVRTMARLAGDGRLAVGGRGPVRPPHVRRRSWRGASRLPRPHRRPFGDLQPHIRRRRHDMGRAGPRHLRVDPGADPSRVTGVTTEDYSQDRKLAVRPRCSALDLEKLRSVGFTPMDWRHSLEKYLSESTRLGTRR